jgi:hypothetical protein
MLSVVMLNVIILSVMAPSLSPFNVARHLTERLTTAEFEWRHDTQHKALICVTQHNDTLHNNN